VFRGFLELRYLCYQRLSNHQLQLYFTTCGYIIAILQLPATTSCCAFQVSGTVLLKYIMAKKMFLNRERAIPTTEAPSVSREDIAPFTSRNNFASETTKQLPFRILDETFKSFPKFNTTGRSLLIKFNSLGEEQDPTTYLKECITALTDYLVDKVPDRDLVGLRIRNTENVQDKVVGISLRRRDQLKADVVWSVLGKVIESNARFALTDRLEVHLDHVRMPAGNGRVKTKGRSLDVLSELKRVL